MAEPRIIVDTGPLVAFLVREEKHHRWVAEQFRNLSAPFLTCEPVLTEAFFLTRRLPHGQDRFFAMLNSGLLRADFSVLGEAVMLEKLIQRYDSVPMSLADACLVRLAELHPSARIFTLDADFHIYRRSGRQAIPLLMPG